jgi:adenylate kinase family enzyme
MKIIILLGVHGSGKGEQMKLLVKKGYVEDYISTGEAYRNVFNPKSRYYKYRNTYGKYVGYSEKGKYPPDKEVNDMVKDLLRIEKKKGCKVIGMEGYPRRIGQAKSLLKMVREIGDVEIQYIYLDLSDEEGIKRIMHRDTYDKHGESLAANKKRIALYHRLTDRAISYLRERVLVTNVDDRPSIEEVHNAIVKVICH